ncbi:MAG: hypothetical protein HY204_06445 [Nitrospirae bacterium]|nr:hypothetical protein [Nitrospirota bacterium]
MGYEELIRDLRREAELKKEAILKTAREDADGILADALRQCDRMEQDFQASLARDAERERTRLLNRARREARMEKHRAESELVQQVFHRLWERLAAVASDPRYPSVVERLLGECLPEWPAGEVIVRADPKTQSLLKPRVKGRTVRFEPLRETIRGEDPGGGFELSGRDETIIIRNTFRSRLEKARPELRIEINRLLFESV